MALLPLASLIAAAAPAHTSPASEFTLYTSSRRLLAMMRIAGSTPFPVVFDTGTNGNVLDLGLSDRLGLPATGPSQSVDGAGKPVPGHQIALHGATLGGVALPDGPATAAPYDLTDEVGVVGPNSFPGRLVRVEPALNRVTILDRGAAASPHCPGFSYSGAFSFEGGSDDTLPTADLSVGDLTLVAEVDTGNTAGLLLPTSLIGKVPLEAPPTPAGFSQSAVEREPKLRARIAADVKVAGIVLHHPDVLFVASHKPNVGLAVLRAFTLVFDPTGQRDWLIPIGNDPVSCLPLPKAATH